MRCELFVLLLLQPSWSVDTHSASSQTGCDICLAESSELCLQDGGAEADEVVELLQVGLTYLPGSRPRSEGRSGDAEVSAASTAERVKAQLQPHGSIIELLALSHQAHGPALLGLVVAVVVPYVGSFLASLSLLCRKREVEASKCFVDGDLASDAAAEGDRPKSIAYIIDRIGVLLLVQMIAVFAFSVPAESQPYLYLNSFARRYSGMNSRPNDMHCETDMTRAECKAAVQDGMYVQMVIGFVEPFVHLLVGPALGAISDAYGRRPALIFIRASLLVSMAVKACVPWFGLSIWVDLILCPLGLMPIFAVPTAWIIDRLQHAPSVPVAVGLVEAVVLMVGLLGTIVGSLVNVKTAFAIGTVGRLLALLGVIFLVPESLPQECRTPLENRSIVPVLGLRVLVRNPVMKKLTLLVGIIFFQSGGFNLILGRHLLEHLHWSRQQAYQGTILDLISSIVWLFLGIGLLLRALGAQGVLAFGMLASCVRMLLAMMASLPWHIFIAAGSLTGPSALMAPIVNGLLSKVAPLGDQGLLQAAQDLCGSLASALGRWAFATVYSQLGVDQPEVPSWKVQLYIAYVTCFTFPALLLVWSLFARSEGSVIEGAKLVSE